VVWVLEHKNPMKLRFRPSTFLIDLVSLRLILTMNGRIFPFANHVKHLSVIFDKRIIWRLHTKVFEAKAFRTFITIYSLFKCKHLRSNITLTFHKALIKSVLTYARPPLELVAETYLLKLQCPQKVFCTIENFSRYTPVCDLHVAFNLPHVYDYITKLCRQQAKVIQNHENEHVHKAYL
jgi:hypothetical protein